MSSLLLHAQRTTTTCLLSVLTASSPRLPPLCVPCQTEFVFTNTRNASRDGPSRVGRSDESSSGGGGGDDEECDSSGWQSLRPSEPASSVSSLLATVQSESAVEHLTAGLRHAGSADEGQDQVLARLARQLAALGLAADQSFQTLAFKRTIIMRRMMEVSTMGEEHGCTTIGARYGLWRNSATLNFEAVSMLMPTEARVKAHLLAV